MSAFSSIPLISWTNTISLFEWKFPCHNSMQILFMYLLLSGCLVPATRRRCGDRGDIAWLWLIYMVIGGSLGNCTGDRCVIYGCTQSLPSNYCVLAFICFQSSIVVWNVFQLIVYIISFKGGGGMFFKVMSKYQRYEKVKWYSSPFICYKILLHSFGTKWRKKL